MVDTVYIVTDGWDNTTVCVVKADSRQLAIDYAIENYEDNFQDADQLFTVEADFIILNQHQN